MDLPARFFAQIKFEGRLGEGPLPRMIIKLSRAFHSLAAAPPPSPFPYFLILVPSLLDAANRSACVNAGSVPMDALHCPSVLYASVMCSGTKYTAQKACTL